MASNITSISRGGKTIRTDIRARLIDAHEAGVTYKQMERLYGVKKDNAYRICSLKQYNANPRGGTKEKKMDVESIAFVLHKVELRPDITLLELKNALSEETGLAVSISTIARCLEGQLISMKKLELVPGTEIVN